MKRPADQQTSRPADQQTSRPADQQTSRPADQQVSNKLKSQFLRLYKIANCDSDYSALELHFLYNFGAKRGVDKDEMKEILKNHYQEIIPDKLEEKIEYLYDLASMVWADRIVSVDEKDMLDKYCKNFGFEYYENVSKYLITEAKNETPLRDVKEYFIDNFKVKI